MPVEVFDQLSAINLSVSLSAFEPGKQAEVVAQYRERCAQFVAGVLQQFALLGAAGLHGGEHGIERRAQPV